MIDLFSVKLNGEYDDIGAVPTVQNGLFLCDTDGETYTRGYSYKITDGSAGRIDSVNDYKIKQAIYPTIQSVCEWLNNWFYSYCTCPRTAFDNPVIYKTGQLCKVYYDKNFYAPSYITVENDVITYDNSIIEAGKHRTDIMHIPQDFELAISQIIHYDVFTRGTVDGLKSENIGSYSYTKNDTTIGTLSYPYELVAGLEVNYKKIRFVQ